MMQQGYGRCVTRSVVMVTVTTAVTFVTTLAFLKTLNEYVEVATNRKFEDLCMASRNCR